MTNMKDFTYIIGLYKEQLEKVTYRKRKLDLSNM